MILKSYQPAQSVRLGSRTLPLWPDTGVTMARVFRSGTAMGTPMAQTSSSQEMRRLVSVRVEPGSLTRARTCKIFGMTTIRKVCHFNFSGFVFVLSSRVGMGTMPEACILSSSLCLRAKVRRSFIFLEHRCSQGVLQACAHHLLCHRR